MTVECDKIFSHRQLLDAQMKVEVICVGLPHKKIPSRLIRTAQFVEKISARKKKYKVTLFCLYNN